MLVLGIDPGVSTTGYGLIEARGPHLVFRDAGELHSSASLALPRRLHLLCAQLEELLDGCDPLQVSNATQWRWQQTPASADPQGTWAMGKILIGAGGARPPGTPQWPRLGDGLR